MTTGLKMSDKELAKLADKHASFETLVDELAQHKDVDMEVVEASGNKLVYHKDSATNKADKPTSDS